MLIFLLSLINMQNVGSMLKRRFNHNISVKRQSFTELSCSTHQENVDLESCKNVNVNVNEIYPLQSEIQSSLYNEKKSQNIPQSSFTISSIGLLKNCVGAGVFSIHSRIGNLPVTSVSYLIYFMALWATYNFFLIGETCRLTNSSTYSEAWSNTVSTKSRWVVQLVVVIAPIVSCLANCIVLADIFRLLFQSLGFPVLVYENRNLVITLLSTFILYPLCIQKSFSGLKTISILGLLGHLTAMLALLETGV